jgi:hypothetical protein
MEQAMVSVARNLCPSLDPFWLTFANIVAVPLTPRALLLARHPHDRDRP